MIVLGQHLIVDLYDCPTGLIDDPRNVEQTMMTAAKKSGATIIQPFFHRFAPQGISGVIIVAESHFSIHTWPEHNYAALDIFTCDARLDFEAAIEVVEAGFMPQKTSTTFLERGRTEVARLRSLPGR